jgi:ABC-2 type transport system ATP-binding protein
MPDAIVLQSLRRTFRTFRKEPGFFGTLKSVIRRDWREVAAVDSLSCTIREGEFVGFLGPNGAGKTTTLKLLSGILTPTAGTCSVLGFTPHQRKRAFRRQIALVAGQKSQLIWDLPPMDTFELHRDLYEIDAASWRRTLDELTALLRVSHVLGTPVRQLSLGERMKCEIILSLLHEPRVLFLDEPTIGLDVTSQIHLWEFLAAYQAERRLTVLLTSHYVQDIANLCERVIIINAGKKAFDGDLTALVELVSPERSGVLRLSQHLQEEHVREVADLVKRRHLEQIDAGIYRVRATKDQLSSLSEAIFKKLPVEEFHMEEVDLRSVIERAFAMTGTPSSSVSQGATLPR